MKAAGIIFSNIHDSAVSELTQTRTVASVPFLCRYRLIDFALSGMVNADIWNIGVITHSNYHSLMEHIGSGKDFDLARRSGGVKILPPHVTAFGSGRGLYSTRLEALMGIHPYISELGEELVVLSDCDTVCNADIRTLISEHCRSGADITVAVAGGRHIGGRGQLLYRSDPSGNLCDIVTGQGHGITDAAPGLNITVMESRLLSHLVADAAVHGYTSFTKDILLRGRGRYRIRTCPLPGYSATIGSLWDYYAVQMELIRDKSARDELFRISDRPVYTKRQGSPPTVYSRDSRVTRSLVADGCTIHGTVENSVLFRGVTVGEGAVVRNSIIMQDTVIGEGASLDYVICDKGAIIRRGRTLSGCEGTPFYIPKGRML